ncbi:MAG: GNAT family N-acetyltransferase [bacterium]
MTTSPDDIHLRPLRRPELGRFIELGYPTCAFLHGRKSISKALQKERFSQFVLQHALEEGSEIHVLAGANEQIVGQLWLHTSRNQFNGQKELWIWDLTIDPAYRRRGLGSRLVQFARHRAAQLGCQELWLLVAEDNRMAHKLYDDAGLLDAARLMKATIDGQDIPTSPSAQRIGRITVRLLQEKDMGAMLELWRTAKLEYRPRGRDTPEKLKAELRRTPDLFWGAFDGEKIVGSIIGTFEGRNRKGWLNRLAVHPDYRRAGLAKALMSVCESSLRERGVKIIAVLVLEENEASAKLIEACGYTHFPYVRYYTKRESPDT